MGGGLVCACALALALTHPTAAYAQVTLTDVAGRMVTLPEGPQRLLVDDGRYLLTLSLLSLDPSSVLAGWPHDAHRIGEETYRDFSSRFPRIENVPRVSGSGNAFSLELALAANPTVAVVTMGRGPSDAQVRAMEAAGVPVVFVDFVARPLENVDRSLEILGALVGRESEAAELVAFRRDRRERIERRLAEAAPNPPSVFVETHAGLSPSCCNSPGKAGLGEYVALAGGDNIGADVLPGAAGQLSLEYVIQRNPSIYVATGGPHVAAAGGFVVGPGFTEAEARASLARMSQRQGLRLVDAVRAGRVYGLAHQLLNSPLDIVALELLATWMHPSLFEDVHPEETLAEINRRFLAVPIEGAHWVVVR